MREKKSFSDNCFSVDRNRRDVFGAFLPIVLAIVLIVVIPATLKQNIRSAFKHVQSAVYTSVTVIEGLKNRFKEKLLSKEELEDFCEILIRQNEFLQAKLAESNNVHVTDSIHKIGKFTPRYAKVIRRDVLAWADEIVINVGLLDGIKNCMGVISKNNVVGCIKDVADHESTVMLTTSPMFRIACHVLDDAELNPVTFSGVKGNSIHSSHGQAYNVPSKLLPDDGSVVLVSSELSGIFPENLTIGTIRSLDNTGEKYISAAVDLDDDVLSKLYEVSVLVPEE